MASLLNTMLKPGYRVLNSIMGNVRRKQSARIPRVELKPEHIRNLRVVTNRDAFLQALPKGGVVAEIGVNRGEFSERILTLNTPEQLHLIDAWSTKRYHSGLGLEVESKFAKQIALGEVQVHVGYSTDLLPRFEDDSFDWIYIDTDHSYALTAAELAIARNKVKPGGIIAGHDYVTGNWDGGVRYGVVEAVHEFCVQHGWELILLTHETDRHLSFAIRAMDR